jgi:hypothetical protein
METILAILLYLQLIMSPGTYTDTYINQLETAHQVEIDAVQADPEQMEIVNSVYLPKVSQVIVINDQFKD